MPVFAEPARQLESAQPRRKLALDLPAQRAPALAVGRVPPKRERSDRSAAAPHEQSNGFLPDQLDDRRERAIVGELPCDDARGHLRSPHLPRRPWHRRPAPARSDRPSGSGPDQATVPGTQLADQLELVGDDDQRAAARDERAEAIEAAPPKPLVADGQHLVEDQDVRLETDHHRKRETRRHPRRVVLDRLVDERADAENSTIAG